MTYVCEVTSSGSFLKTSNLPDYIGSSSHLITVQPLQNNGYFVYLTKSERIIKLNMKLQEITIEPEFKERKKLEKKGPTRLCCFNQNSFLIGTKHGGAYIISELTQVN